MATDSNEEIESLRVDLALIAEDAKVYSALVPSESDDSSKFEKVSGMIAYAQYSLQKHQFVNKCIQEDGQPPTSEGLKLFTRATVDAVDTQELLQKSKALLKAYAEEYLENADRRDIFEPIEKIVKDNTKFWLAVRVNLFSTFLCSVVVFVLLSTALVRGPDDKLSRIINILMENTSDSTPAQTSAPLAPSPTSPNTSN